MRYYLINELQFYMDLVVYALKNSLRVTLNFINVQTLLFYIKLHYITEVISIAT